MVQYCVAFGCRERSNKGTSISFHSFPSDENLRKIWELSLRRENFEASRHSRVCSKHFAPECFDMEAFGKGRRLKKDSVPSIFDVSEQLQTQLVKREAPKEEVATSSDFCESNISTIVDEINANMKCSNSSEMDTKIEIKEECPFSDITSQDEREFFPRDVATEIKKDAVHPSNDCDAALKTEFKSEPGLQEDTEFLPTKIEQYSNDQEVDTKVEIKEDCWLETSFAGISSGCNEVKEEDFHYRKSLRLCTEAVSDDCDNLPVHSAPDSGRETSLYNVKNHPERTRQKRKFTKHSGECSNGTENDNSALHLKQKHFILKNKRRHRCDICEKRFTSTSNLKRHKFIHGEERPHNCNICGKGFVSIFNLKRHQLIHGNVRPHKCDICKKGFTTNTHLKRHKSIHGNERLHKCDVCEKSFNIISHLKRHKFIHGDERPHKCKTCHRSFIQSSFLKLHILTHEGRKPHKCQICQKRFTQLSHLKVHSLTHEVEKPHKCQICQKRFTQLSHLRRHSSVHQQRKPMQVVARRGFQSEGSSK